MIELIGKKESNHFFGFHDLLITNKEETKILAIEIDDISKPPYPNEKNKIGYFDKSTNLFVSIKEGCAYNYPQGARQQWLGTSNNFVFNDLVDKKWGSHIVDTDSNTIIKTNNFPIHSFNDNNNEGYFFNYARVHRVGGYGYIGVDDISKNDDIPSECGVFSGNIKDDKVKLLISIAEIAACGETKAIVTGYPHYVTHLCLNPSKKRIAFLHRYRLLDGGENTRLMTVNIDGSDLRCLSKGFLSHFTWLNDDDLFIWGQKSAGVSNLRESKFFNSKIVSFGVSIIKKVARKFLTSSINAVNKKSFLVINDSDTTEAVKVAEGILDEDGHPMINPVFKEWIVNDTYPDNNGIRTLMLYNTLTNKKIELGTFKMLDDKPNLKTFSIEKVQEGIDERIKDKFPIDLYCFTRSGFHCDLHPRWSNNGEVVYFDSIHEGARQIYSVEVSKYLK